MQDAQTFIRLNPQIPNLIAIADKAAVLGVTVPTGSTENIEKASSQLLALLTPLAGYTEFVVARDKERADDRHKKVIANQKELERIRSALTKWVAANISSPKLPQVVQELKLVTEALPLDDLERLQEARQSVDSLISKNNLDEELNRNQTEAGAAPVSLDRETAAPFAVTPANAILLRGARSDVVALYNSSAEAPSLVRTLNGEFSFSRGTANVCLFGVDGSPSVKRGLRAALVPLGATAIQTTTCDSGSPKRADVLLIGRKAFLEAKPSLAISFIDALEDKKLRLFEPIEFAKLAAKQTEEAQLVADIASGVEAGTRKGYGAVEFAVSEGELCVATAEHVEVHEQALNEVAALVEEPRFAPIARSRRLEELYPEILRDKCRVFYGPASSLRQLAEALKRDERDYAYLPIWIDESAIAAAVAQRVAAEQEKIKQAENERLAADEQARMEALRREKEAARRTVVEAELQKANGPAATARLIKFTDNLKAALFQSEDKPDAAQHSLEPYKGVAAWLDAQIKDGWELVSVDTAVGDFGSVMWKERKLDALVTKTSLKLKSRERGEYRTECLLFGIVLDDEFDMVRDAIDAPCAEDATKMSDWKIGHSFDSRWLVASEVPSKE